MLKLYHSPTSVCSQKVRLTLSEKDLPWESLLLDLGKGEQFQPAYVKLNPESVVPTLVDGDLVIRESSVIAEYLDEASASNPLMPGDRAGAAAARYWLLRSLALHGAINTMSFATAMRERELASSTPEQLEEKISRMPDPQNAAKRRDLLGKGLESVHVDSALYTLGRALREIDEALASRRWVASEAFSLGDIAVLPYIDRLERLGMAGLWERFPRVDAWLSAARMRPSYKAAMEDYIPAEAARKTRDAGSQYWPAIARKLA